MNKSINGNKKNISVVIIFILAIIVSLACIIYFSQNVKASWKEDENGKTYILDNGEKAVGFQEIDDLLYYFDEDGYLETGKLYFEDEDVYYYADENGVIQTGVIEYDGGIYITDDSGKIQTGFVQMDGKTYYFNSRAEQLFDWFKLGDDWYYADEEGVIQTGFLTLNGYRYYLDTEGKRVSDTVMEIDGVTYIFSSDGSIDENATLLYPIYHYISEQRKVMGMNDIIMDNKVQACALIRATGLAESFADNTDDQIENMLKNRGIKSNGGYEFSYGGIVGYDIDKLMVNLGQDDRFKSALNDPEINVSGIGMYTEDDKNYFDIILVSKQ